MSFSLSSTPSFSSDLETYAKEASRLIKEGKHHKAVVPYGKVIDILISNNDLNTALKLSNQLSKATDPSISEFGYYQRSKVFSAAYDATGDKEHLIQAASSLSLFSTSHTALVLISMYAEKYGDNLDDFLNKVSSSNKTITSDRTLESAILHIKNDRWELTKSYIKEGLVDVNAQQSSDGASMLHMAVWFNKIDVVKSLINTHDANINIRDTEGDTPLKYAQHKGYSSITQYLKNKGATL